MLRCDRVYEKNKQRLRLREAGYAGLSLLFSELHITPTLIRCLLNQVLHTGSPFILLHKWVLHFHELLCPASSHLESLIFYQQVSLKTCFRLLLSLPLYSLLPIKANMSRCHSLINKINFMSPSRASHHCSWSLWNKKLCGCSLIKLQSYTHNNTLTWMTHWHTTQLKAEILCNIKALESKKKRRAQVDKWRDKGGQTGM